MAVYGVDSIRIGDRDVMRLDPQQLAVLLMEIMDRTIPLAPSTLVEQPQIAEARREWRRDVVQIPSLQVRQDVEGDGNEEEGVRREEEREDHLASARIIAV